MLYFHELKRVGAKVQTPGINKGDELTNINEPNVYMGFVHIKSI